VICLKEDRDNQPTKDKDQDQSCFYINFSLFLLIKLILKIFILSLLCCSLFSSTEMVKQTELGGPSPGWIKRFQNGLPVRTLTGSHAKAGRREGARRRRWSPSPRGIRREAWNEGGSSTSVSIDRLRERCRGGCRQQQQQSQCLEETWQYGGNIEPHLGVMGRSRKAITCPGLDGILLVRLPVMNMIIQVTPLIQE